MWQSIAALALVSAISAWLAIRAWRALRRQGGCGGCALAGDLETPGARKAR
ncbi:MAG: hypothetical protein HY716_13725 [Planctomycetes bacterium]|nr:hypothetical protein [Planctomycetota bacterium]